jgi:hypothetical protein
MNMIELYLSSDGKHTVHVSAETPEVMDKLAAYADKLYARVLEQYGTKPQLWEAARNGQANGQTSAAKPSAPKAQEPAAAPLCPKHGRELAYRKGRFGDFWSCPTRLPDGSWCAYTEQVPAQSNGQKVYDAHA